MQVTELVDGSRICLDCESVVTITKGERQYVEAHKMKLPKRCHLCRRLRKDAKESVRAQRRALSANS